MISKRALIQYSILLLTILISFSIILVSQNPTFHLMGFWLIVIVILYITRFDLTHPLMWFSGSFALYNTGYSLLYVLGYPVNSGYSKDNIILSLLALSVVLLIIGVRKYDIGGYFNSENFNIMSSKSNKRITELILISLLALLLFSIFMLHQTPFIHKNEMLAARDIFFVLGAYCTRFLTFFSCFYSILFVDIDKIKTKLFIFSSLILILLFSLFTGERDAMFRFIVAIIVVLVIREKLSKRMLMLLIPISMVAIIVGRYFKYYFVSGIVNTSIKGQPFIYNFLTSDFHAAGENLQVLLNNSWTKSIHGFSLIAVDFISPFFSGESFINVGNWFNNTFYPGSYSRAFTLLGEGYVIGGILGIAILFTILGFGIKFLYKKSTKNIYWLVVYIYSIPTIISAFRSTLGTVTIALTRIALLSIAIHYFVNYLINRKRIKSNKSTSGRNISVSSKQSG